MKNMGMDKMLKYYKDKYINSGIVFVVIVMTLPVYIFALKPSVDYSDNPRNYPGIAVEDVSFKTTDGLTLTGWFFSQADSALPRRSTIIIAGGDAGNMADLLFYTGMTNNGLNVLLFDYRGFGKSSPWTMDSKALMYPQFISDLEAAVAYIKTRKDVDTTSLGLFGISMGAILCLGVAAKHPEVHALVVDGISTSTSDVIKVLYKVKNKTLTVPGGYPPDDEPINAFKKLTHCKVMVIAGDKDLNTPVWMAKKLYNIAPNKGMLQIIKGAKHGYGPVMDENVYTKKIPEFFSSALVK